MTPFVKNATIYIMSIIRVLLILGMFTQPFCCHCFAQMRMISECVNSVGSKTLKIDVNSFPVESGSVCTKKHGLSTPKIDISHFHLMTYAWHGVSPVEVFFAIFTSPGVKILNGDSAHCPTWLRFSALLI